MTAISSILGFLPLIVASGAGAASRQAVGNAVVGGMIAATFFSLLFTPAFFVVFQRLSEWKPGTAGSGTAGSGTRSSGEVETIAEATETGPSTESPG